MKITCFRISNGALAARELPRRLKILAWGDNPACFGINPRLGDHTQSAFPRRMKARNLDKVAIDFEHNTVEGTPAHAETVEPRNVAGYGAPLLVPGDGLFLDDIEWTPCGKEHAANFIDLSPACCIDPRTGEVDFLHSVALTRAGAVEGLSFYSVDANQGDGMDWRKWLLALVGKGEETPDEELQAAFEGKIRALSVEAMATATGAAGEAVTKLSADLVSVRGELTSLSAELARRDREALVTQAAREGKVVPLSSEQVAAMDLATLRDLVGNLPVTVPLDRRTPERIQTLSVDTVSPALDAVAKRCGLDPKKVLELNKK